MYSKFLLPLVVCCVLGASALGYVLEGQTWPQGSTVTMQLSLGGNQTLIDGFTSFNQTAEDALALWNQKLARLQFAVVRNSAVPPTDGDRRNSVFFSNTVFGQAFGSSTLATTLRTYTNSTTLEADVVFNSAKSFNSYRGTLKTASNGGTLHDLHRVAIHEFGHVLGLDHPDEKGQTVDAIMNSFESDVDALRQDDIRGGQSLYGAAANSAPTPTPAPASPNNLVNLSTRGYIGTGASALIGGFIVQGSQPTSVVIRALGPSLAASGVAGTNSDPVLELRDQSGNLLQQNDDWQDNAGAAATLRSNGLAPTNDRESALIANLAAGNYTAVVTGYNGEPGVGLVEVYDLHTSNARVANISTRDNVLTGDRVMISGFIIGGNQPKQVVLRAIGPSLSNSGITGALADPVLELRNSSGNRIGINDNWRDGADAAAIQSAGFAPANDHESALLMTLNPGTYTAIVTGYNGSTGVALSEVYDLSPAPAQ
ncbi:MAG: DVUA0089 family protein [Verrucomicrobiota bacterium]|nr:DVUA0089 family protein [Verrucomicrobiota bacterium]